MSAQLRQASPATASERVVRNGPKGKGITSVAGQTYLKAAIVDAGDQFGYSLALSGSTLVVGAPEEDGAAPGAGQGGQDNSVPGSGAAYVFVRRNGSWEQQAYLKASNAEENDDFGVAVAICGDTIVVGAIYESSASTGVNGEADDNSMPSSGAAYVFVRSGDTWRQQAYLKASNPGPGDLFGWSVDVSGDTVVVGAFGEDSAARGVNGDGSDDFADRSGAAYVFVREGETWREQAYLKASNAGAGDGFGVSVAVFGDTVAVGAVAESSSARGVNGDGHDDSAVAAGAAYVFVREGEIWREQAYIKASNSDADDRFGQEVALFRDTLVVGAVLEDGGARTVNGDGADNSVLDSGAAYVFVREADVWTEEAYLKPSNPGSVDRFGDDLAVSGDVVVVSARREDSPVGGSQDDDSLTDSGAAYVFVRGDVGWRQQSMLKAHNAGQGDWFGNDVALEGDVVAVGAPLESSRSTGIDGDGDDDGADRSGAAYVFPLRSYRLGGSVVGLVGSGLELRNRAEDPLAISSAGSFTFDRAMVDGTRYRIAVARQPVSPHQTCTVANGSGTVSSADITHVEVTCSTNTFSVGGTLSGLSGSGLVLRNNGGDDLALGGN
ncbi:FG-GAP repeat protein, partial [Pseudomarimonas salicorniae]|nr:FG-GAP repeat protein [Lysobacter sp. CAU 1642]